MWKGAPYFDTGRETCIKVLPKKDKDPLKPLSYRPISFIHVDAKILSKITAKRLVTILPSLINTSQSGFVKGRSGAANIRKVLLALEYSKNNPTMDSIIITLDAEKTFDNINLDWLFCVMGAMGFHGHIMSFLAAQYAQPLAKINSTLALSYHCAFILHKGTRQGCPLSPLLFNITIEPLARHILQSQDITGIPVSPSQNLKLAMFADDILLFTSTPEYDLLNLT